MKNAAVDVNAGLGGQDERNLVARLKAGDDLAFEFVVRTYSGRLLAVARRMLRNEEDAQDALQSAFLSAFRGIQSFEGGAQVSTWLHRIVVNAALMKLRTCHRKPEEPIDSMLPQFLEDGHQVEPVSPWKEPEQLLQQKETRAFVRVCINRLPESYKTVLLMRDIEELSTEETAVMLGVTANAVKIRLHRARQALATLLNDGFNTNSSGFVSRSTMQNSSGESGMQSGRSLSSHAPSRKLLAFAVPRRGLPATA